jgi:hypothetical protein
MKNIFALFLMLCLSQISFAQDVPQFSLSEIKSKEELNNTAKKAADYILATPADSTVTMRRQAEQFLFAWIEKTDEYSFAVDYTIAKIIEENKSAAYVVFAAMAECLFKDKSQSDEDVKIIAMRRLIKYSENTTNKLPPGPVLKEIMKAEKKGKLKRYLSEMN